MPISKKNLCLMNGMVVSLVVAVRATHPTPGASAKIRLSSRYVMAVMVIGAVASTPALLVVWFYAWTGKKAKMGIGQSLLCRNQALSHGFVPQVRRRVSCEAGISQEKKEALNLLLKYREAKTLLQTHHSTNL